MFRRRTGSQCVEPGRRRHKAMPALDPPLSQVSCSLASRRVDRRARHHAMQCGPAIGGVVRHRLGLRFLALAGPYGERAALTEGVAKPIAVAPTGTRNATPSRNSWSATTEGIAGSSTGTSCESPFGAAWPLRSALDVATRCWRGLVLPFPDTAAHGFEQAAQRGVARTCTACAGAGSRRKRDATAPVGLSQNGHQAREDGRVMGFGPHRVLPVRRHFARWLRTGRAKPGERGGCAKESAGHASDPVRRASVEPLSACCRGGLRGRTVAETSSMPWR